MIPLKVQADYSLGLWTTDGGYDPELVGLPETFCTRFNDWVARYCEEDDAPDGFNRDAYNCEGWALAHEIKRFLGTTYTVTYRYFNLPGADGEPEGIEEPI